MRKYGPFDTSVFYEVENRRLQRAFNPDTGFVVAGQGAVAVGTGAELVIGAYPDGALIDGMYVENPEAETVPLTTNTTSTNQRIDRLVLRLDMTAKTIAPVQIVGTPAASPVAPALTKTDTVVDMPLYRFTMPGSAAAQAPSNLVDERALIGDTGWVNITTRSGKGFATFGTPAVKRKNGVLYFKDGWTSAGMTPGAVFTVGDLPASIPTSRPWNGSPGMSNGSVTGRLIVQTDRQIIVVTGSDLSSYYEMDPVVIVQ